jgi:putative membrane protein
MSVAWRPQGDRPAPEPPPRPAAPGLEGRSADEESFRLSSRRTRLSFQRTRMSADRTLMSIVRTALSLIGFGFTIFQFFRYLRQSAGAGFVGAEAARNFGVTLVATGILLLVLGIVGHVRFMLELRADHDALVAEHAIPADHFPYSVTLAVSVLLLLVGLAAIASMVMRVGPFH